MTPLSLLPKFLWNHIILYLPFQQLTKLYNVHYDYNILYGSKYAMDIIENKLSNDKIKPIIHGPIYCNLWPDIIKCIDNSSLEIMIKSCDELTDMGVTMSIHLKEGIYDFLYAQEPSNYAIIGIEENVILQIDYVKCNNIRFENITLKNGRYALTYINCNKSIELYNCIIHTIFHGNATDINIISCWIMDDFAIGGHQSGIFNIIGNILAGNCLRLFPQHNQGTINNNFILNSLYLGGTYNQIIINDNFIKNQCGITLNDDNNIFIMNNNYIHCIYATIRIECKKSTIILNDNNIKKTKHMFIVQRDSESTYVLVYSGNVLPKMPYVKINKSTSLNRDRCAKIFYTNGHPKPMFHTNNKPKPIFYQHSYIIKTHLFAPTDNIIKLPLKITNIMEKHGLNKICYKPNILIN